MDVKLFRDGADGKCLGPLLHKTKAVVSTLSFVRRTEKRLRCRRQLCLDDKGQRSKTEFTLTPLLPLDSHHSSARTCAAVLSFPPRSPSAAQPALRQIDRRAQ